MNMITLESWAKLEKAYFTKIEIQQIKNYFTMANPLFHQLENMGKATWATPARLFYFRETDDFLEIPIGGAAQLPSIIGNKKITIADNRYENPKKIKIKFKGTLRDYQATAKDEMTKRTVGTIQATTGAGKTIIAIAAICERKQPTLFLVNTIELANQFKARLLTFSDIKEEDIGLIGSGKFEIRDVSIGILQTITKLPDDKIDAINSHFGQVFVDEVHIVPANTFFTALSKLKQKFRFGLTATPFRSDGLTDVIFFTTGSIVHKIDPKLAEEHLIIPDVEYVETEYKFPVFESTEHAIMITDMAVDSDRNKLILDKYKEVGVERQSVFISHRQSQLAALAAEIKDSAILTSATSKKKRVQIIADLNSGKLRAVLTTYGLFSTGIDIGTLEVVYMCTPIRSPRWLIQTVGRLKRKAAGKENALVVDFVDKKIQMLRNQYYARRSTWKKIRNQEI